MEGERGARDTGWEGGRRLKVEGKGFERRKLDYSQVQLCRISFSTWLRREISYRICVVFARLEGDETTPSSGSFVVVSARWELNDSYYDASVLPLTKNTLARHRVLLNAFNVVTFCSDSVKVGIEMELILIFRVFGISILHLIHLFLSFKQ